MVVENFVDRERELRALKERLSSDRFELVLIYGRRRIGKTSLVLRALEGDYVYYLATERGNLRKFKGVAKSKFPEVGFAKEDWEAVFHYLRDKVVVIDEFPYLIREDPTILSTFQRVVDEVLKGTRTKLILLGSSISLMEDAMSYKSPLFGRRTASMEVRELRFKALRGFGLPLRDAIEVYGFAGGVPYYVAKAGVPFLDWLNEELKRPDTFIKDEMDFMLRYEFVETGTYKEILYAISQGKNTLGEIKDFVRVGGDVSSYLKKLERVGLVGREYPLGSKKGARYVILDNFTAFWFRFIYPNLSRIEEGNYEVKEGEYNEYLGRVFERVAREYVADVYKASTGRVWRGEVEIDLYGDGIAGECKWSEKVDCEEVLDDLKEKAEKLNLNVKKFVVFAKSFSRTCEGADYVDLRKLEEWYNS
ncbi:MAG: ATP-binding protein [Thermoprotei archaeon]